MITYFTSENTSGLTDHELQELNDRLLSACPDLSSSEDAFCVWLAANPARIYEETVLIMQHVNQFGMW